MPIKHNLTRYDVLSGQMQKVACKDEHVYTAEDRMLRDMATIIAAFSSGSSWRTHRELTTGGCADFSSPEVKEEYAVAKVQKWKGVSPFDISELAQKGVSQFKFERWLYYNVDGARHESYKKAWAKINEMVGRDIGMEELSRTR